MTDTFKTNKIHKRQQNILTTETWTRGPSSCFYLTTTYFYTQVYKKKRNVQLVVVSVVVTYTQNP